VSTSADVPRPPSGESSKTTRRVSRTGGDHLGRQKLILLLINVVGGIAVIGSYILGLKGDSGAEVLWGGVPEGIRPIYTVSMILSAIGYFAFLNLLLLRVDPKEVTVGGHFAYSIFYPYLRSDAHPLCLLDAAHQPVRRRAQQWYLGGHPHRALPGGAGFYRAGVGPVHPTAGEPRQGLLGGAGG